MSTLPTTLRPAAVISLLLVAPFAILEALNNGITRQNAPGLALMFGLMWLLPAAFIIILVPLVRSARAGHGALANPARFLFSLALLALIGAMWVGIVIDQLPCFLGVPNCD